MPTPSVKIQPTIELEKFLSFSACVIRNLGYVSGKVAKETGKQSTGEIAWEWATKGRPEIVKNVNFLPEDRFTGEATAKWMGGIDPKNNDYLINLKGIGLSQVVSRALIGYAASAIESKEREEKRNRENDSSRPENKEKFLGVIGEKISTQAKYISRSRFDSRFGVCHKYVFEDGDGRKISWMTGTDMTVIEQGHVYLLRGRVKKHSGYKGSFETEITRASILGS